MGDQTKRLYEFGPFRIDTGEHLLLCDGENVPLPPKVFDTLVVLVENSGHVLGKDELMKAVWPESFVEDVNLAHNISILRKVLSQGGPEQSYIQTMPRRGYRFTAAVKQMGADGPDLLVEKSYGAHILIKEDEEISDPAEAEGPTETNHQASANSNRMPQILIVSLLLIGLALASLFMFRTKQAKQPAAMTIKSIAVLPFKPLAGSDRDEPFELGMADTLITKLSTVRQIIVRPTTAIRRYMTLEQDAVAAGRELGVDLVLEGSIQRDGERVRVTARLMNVEDGAPVWAYRCDEVCTDIFELQDTISADVVQALMLKLTSEQKGLLAKRSTSSVEAYQFYVQGRYSWNKRTDESLRKSIQDFQRAVEIDPGYALAYAGLADSYIVLGSWTSSSIAPKEALLNAKAAATKALEIDNTLAEAHASLADVGLLYEWDWEAVEREFEVALDLNPYYATAHQWYGNYLAAMGRLDESIAETRLAQTLDPLSPIISGALGARLYLARRYDEAIEQFRKTLDKDPDFAYAHASLARAYEQKAVYAEAVSEMRRAAALSEQNTLMLAGLAQAYAVGGNVAQATKILEKLETQSKQRYVSCYELAIIYVALGKQDQAFGWLEKAYEERASYLIFLKVDPRLDSIRSDRRFSNLLRRMELL